MKKVGFKGYKFKGGPNPGKTVYTFRDHEQWTSQSVAKLFGCAVAATTGDTTTYTPSGKTTTEHEKLVEAAEKILDPAFRAKKLEALAKQFKVPQKKY
jgi:Xaa-Pro aminopeptidase